MNFDKWTIGSKKEYTNRIKIYFTCHPDDNCYKADIIQKIIEVSSSIMVFSANDMTEPYSKEQIDLNLLMFHLYVVPVTTRLLTTPNRAMDFDIQYAKEHNIPILPIIMEKGLEELYTKEDKFGDILVYHSYLIDDYEENEGIFRRYMEAVKMTPEMIFNIRQEFDFTLYLSHTKEDDQYAYEFMNLVHQNPKYIDIAFCYYDFFLPPKDLSVNHPEPLKGTEAFISLLTPSLLNALETLDYYDYRGRDDYFAARMADSSKIVVFEMEKTESEVFRTKAPCGKRCLVKKRLMDYDYYNIPPLLNPYNSDELQKWFDNLYQSRKKKDNYNDVLHNYYIGLAYLYGIDMEINRQKAVDLLTLSAEMGNMRAGMMLCEMYLLGNGVKQDYHQALKWLEKYPDSGYYLDNFSMLYCHLNNSDQALKIGKYLCKNKKDKFWYGYYVRILKQMGKIYVQKQDYEKALLTYQKLLEMLKQKPSDNNYETIIINYRLAQVYGKLKDYHKESELYFQIYQELGEDLPETSPFMLRINQEHAKALCHWKRYIRADMRLQEVYERRKKVLGDKHMDTLESLDDLAELYVKMQNYDLALEHAQKVVSLKKEIYSELNLSVAHSLETLSAVRKINNHFDDVLVINQEIYRIYHTLLGQLHSKTLGALSEIAEAYARVKQYSQAYDVYTQLYKYQLQVMGELDMSSIQTLNKRGKVLLEMGNYVASMKDLEEAKRLTLSVVGPDHEFYQKVCQELALTYTYNGYFEEAEKLLKRVVKWYIVEAGMADIRTLAVLKQVGFYYLQNNKAEEALAIYKNVLKTQKETGPRDPLISSTLKDIALVYQKLNEHYQALKCYEEAFELSCRVNGLEHITSIEYLLAFARALDQKGEEEQRYFLYQKVYELKNKILEPESDEILLLTEEIVGVLRQYNLKEALLWEDKAVILAIKKYGKNNILLSSKILSLAVDYEKTLDIKLALQNYEQYFEIMFNNKTLLIKENIEDLKFVINKFLEHREYSKALDLLYKLKDLEVEMFGEESIEVINTLEQIATLHEQLQEYSWAINVNQLLYKYYLKFLGVTDCKTQKIKKLIEELTNKIQ